MEKVRVIYTVNGSTQVDELVAESIVYQREFDTLTVRFPKGDGRYCSSTQRTVSGQRLKIVSYAQADHFVLMETA